MKKLFKKNNQGYALLFTIMIISVISVVTAGLLNTMSKQLVLSSLAKDSQVAFYQADTASDCGLYVDMTDPEGIIETGGSLICGGINLTLEPTSNGYNILPSDISDTIDPCFRIEVLKDTNTKPGYILTEISARGYNFCNTGNIRTVEREIQVTYEEQI